jgi:hypothetical protein
MCTQYLRHTHPPSPILHQPYSSSFTLLLLYVTSPLRDLFFLILLLLVLGLYSSSERKYAAFGFLNLANFPSNEVLWFHSWGYTLRNVGQVTTKAPGHPCLLQHYSQ